MDMDALMKGLAGLTSPYAFVAYALVVAAWLVKFWQQKRVQAQSLEILRTYKSDHERTSALKELLGNAPPAGLDADAVERWIWTESKGKARVYLLVAYIATLAALLVIAGLFYGAMRAEPGPIAVSLTSVEAGAPDCPLPPGARLGVTVAGRTDEFPVTGCRASIPRSHSWPRSGTAVLALVGSDPFTLVATAEKCSLADGTWMVRFRRVEDSPRLAVRLFRYGGTAGREFDDFVSIFSDKLINLGEAMARSHPGCEYVRGLRVDPSGALLVSASERLSTWRSSHALMLFTGFFRPCEGATCVTSEPFWGDLGAEIPPGDVRLTMHVSADELGQTIDSHSLAVVYALAVDAERRRAGREVIAFLLGQAVSIARSIESPPAAVVTLKEALKRALVAQGAPDVEGL